MLRTRQRKRLDGLGGVSLTGGTFTPTSITNLQGWYDASDASTITTATGVATWRDKSGVGNNLTQPTGTQQPATGTRTQNGKNVIVFDGTDDNFMAPAGLYPLFTGDHTIFFMAERDNTARANFYRSSTDYFELYVDASAALQGANNTAFNYSTISGTADTDPHVWGGIRSGANYNTFKDNVNGPTVAATNGTITSLNIPAAAPFQLGGYIGEILIYARALTAGEIAQVYNYLRLKWAATRNISAASQVVGFRNGTASNATDTAHDSKRWRQNLSGRTIYTVQPIYPGWYTDASNEINHTGNMTITASVEYPAGARTQAKFNGNVQGTLLPGANYTTDPVTIAGGIPNGAWYCVRTFITCASGVKWGTSLTFNTDAAHKDGSESGAVGVIVDKTMSGEPVSNTQLAYYPAGVIAQDFGLNKSLAFLGDSIFAGTSDSFNDPLYGTGFPTRASNVATLPAINMAVSGTQAGLQVNNFTARLDLMRKAGITHAVLNWGSNDMNTGGKTPAQTVTAMQTIGGYLSPYMKVYCATVLPRLAISGITVDKYQYIATQTVLGGQYTAGTGSGRHSYNTSVRAGLTNYNGYFELSDNLDVNTSNALTSGGGFLLVGGASPLTYYDQVYSGTLSGTPTTTTMQTGVVKAANYFAAAVNGYIKFTSGVNNGIAAAISTSDAAGNITLTAALASSPASGDTFTLTSAKEASVVDGTHPGVPDNVTPFGSVFRVRDSLVTFIGTLT